MFFAPNSPARPFRSNVVVILAISVGMPGSDWSSHPSAQLRMVVEMKRATRVGGVRPDPLVDLMIAT